MDFEPATENFQKIFDLFSELNGPEIDVLPDRMAERSANEAEKAIAYLNDVLQFSPENTSNPGSARQDLIDKSGQYYQDFFQFFYPYLAYVNVKFRNKNNTEEEVREALEQIRQAVSRADGLGEQLEEQKNHADAIVDAIRTTAAHGGVSKYAGIFEKEAEQANGTARFWGICTVGAAVVAALLALDGISFFAGDDRGLSVQQTITVVVARLVLFSVISFGMFWCARNYAAEKHNFVINRHRHLALTTFEVFVGAAAGDQNTRDAVLLRATEAVFGPLSTGYGSAGDRSLGTSQLVEIVKNAPRPSADG